MNQLGYSCIYQRDIYQVIPVIGHIFIPQIDLTPVAIIYASHYTKTD